MPSLFSLKNLYLHILLIDLLHSLISEGKSAAKTYDCKYIELSAAIDHKIDELLVGILKQMRLMKEQKRVKQWMAKTLVAPYRENTTSWRNYSDDPNRLPNHARTFTCCDSVNTDSQQNALER